MLFSIFLLLRPNPFLSSMSNLRLCTLHLVKFMDKPLEARVKLEKKQNPVYKSSFCDVLIKSYMILQFSNQLVLNHSNPSLNSFIKWYSCEIFSRLYCSRRWKFVHQNNKKQLRKSFSRESFCKISNIIGGLGIATIFSRRDSGQNVD